MSKNKYSSEITVENQQNQMLNESLLPMPEQKKETPPLPMRGKMPTVGAKKQVFKSAAPQKKSPPIEPKKQVIIQVTEPSQTEKEDAVVEIPARMQPQAEQKNPTYVQLPPPPKKSPPIEPKNQMSAQLPLPPKKSPPIEPKRDFQKLGASSEGQQYVRFSQQNAEQNTGKQYVDISMFGSHSAPENLSPISEAAVTEQTTRGLEEGKTHYFDMADIAAMRSNFQERSPTASPLASPVPSPVPSPRTSRVKQVSFEEVESFEQQQKKEQFQKKCKIHRVEKFLNKFFDDAKKAKLFENGKEEDAFARMAGHIKIIRENQPEEFKTIAVMALEQIIKESKPEESKPKSEESKTSGIEQRIKGIIEKKDKKDLIDFCKGFEQASKFGDKEIDEVTRGITLELLMAKKLPNLKITPEDIDNVAKISSFFEKRGVECKVVNENKSLLLLPPKMGKGGVVSLGDGKGNLSVKFVRMEEDKNPAEELINLLSLHNHADVNAISVSFRNFNFDGNSKIECCYNESGKPPSILGQNPVRSGRSVSLGGDEGSSRFQRVKSFKPGHIKNLVLDKMAGSGGSKESSRNFE